MARIAYLLLTHKDPDRVATLARQLGEAGDFLAIHFDARAGAEAFARLQAALQGLRNVAFTRRRIRCGWGDWSLVAASLEAARAAHDAFPEASHFYLISGECMPIKSAAYIHDFLDAGARDYIEAVDFLGSDWIKTGLREERLIYRHLFNERRHKWLFYQSLEWQRRLGLRRKTPERLRIHIGSQWWCLRRQTVAAILTFCAERPDVIAFFRTTWIPDETFFQTLVRHLVPDAEIAGKRPTFLLFSDYGMPAAFHDDHFDFLVGQDYLFARKISPQAHELRKRLGAYYIEGPARQATDDDGERLYHFLVTRGRAGERFAPRFWESGSSIGNGRELLIIAAKKWHVSKRLAEWIRQGCGLHALDHLFDEEEAGLPSLGGIERGLGKRHRHRRAFMRLLFEHFGTERLVICTDTAQADLIADFHADRSSVRLLEIECRHSEADLRGHAGRLGLIGANPAATMKAGLLKSLHETLRAERDTLRDAGFANHYRIVEGASAQENTRALAAFLSLPLERAEQILGTGALFAD